MENKKLRPNLSLIRPGLFWDTDFKKIDWERQHRAIIEHILERGNDQEKEEIKRFYGDAIFQTIADNWKENIDSQLKISFRSLKKS